jgi:hypothetical protein
MRIVHAVLTPPIAKAAPARLMIHAELVNRAMPVEVSTPRLIVFVRELAIKLRPVVGHNQFTSCIAVTIAARPLRDIRDKNNNAHHARRSSKLSRRGRDGDSLVMRLRPNWLTVSRPDELRDGEMPITADTKRRPVERRIAGVGFRERAAHCRDAAAAADTMRKFARLVSLLASVRDERFESADVPVRITIGPDEALRPFVRTEHDVAIMLPGFGGLIRANFRDGLAVGRAKRGFISHD